MHDTKNQSLFIVREVVVQLLDCTLWARDAAEFSWIMHLLSVTCITIINRIGRLAFATLQAGLISPRLEKHRESISQHMLASGLKVQHMKELTIEDDDFKDEGTGYRSQR